MLRSSLRSVVQCVGSQNATHLRNGLAYSQIGRKTNGLERWRHCMGANSLLHALTPRGVARRDTTLPLFLAPLLLPVKSCVRTAPHGDVGGVMSERFRLIFFFSHPFRCPCRGFCVRTPPYALLEGKRSASDLCEYGRARVCV